jgi:hypothetical protein
MAEFYPTVCADQKWSGRDSGLSARGHSQARALTADIPIVGLADFDLVGMRLMSAEMRVAMRAVDPRFHEDESNNTVKESHHSSVIVAVTY